MNDYLYPLIAWGLLTAWSLYVGLYRTHVDRVRAGMSPSPQEENRFSKLVTSLLTTPNQDRPFHIEAALLSFLLIVFGGLWISLFFAESFEFLEVLPLSLAPAFLWERVWANLMPRKISAGGSLFFHLKVGFPLMILVRFICLPFSFLVRMLEGSIFSIAPQAEENKVEGKEVADHIRTLGMESSNMDPEVVEIVTNLVGDANRLAVAMQHIGHFCMPTGSNRPELQRCVKSGSGLQSKNFEDLSTGEERGHAAPGKLDALTPAELPLSVSCFLDCCSHSFGWQTGFCDQAIAFTDQQVADVEGDWYALAATEGGLIISLKVTVLDVVVDKRGLVEALHGNGESLECY